MNWEPIREVIPESSSHLPKTRPLLPAILASPGSCGSGSLSPEEHEKAVAKRFEELQTASEALNTKLSRVKPVMVEAERLVAKSDQAFQHQRHVDRHRVMRMTLCVEMIWHTGLVI